jgi:hypothetical protein
MQQESKAWLRSVFIDDAGKDDALFTWKMDSHEWAARQRNRMLKYVEHCFSRARVMRRTSCVGL